VYFSFLFLQFFLLERACSRFCADDSRRRRKEEEEEEEEEEEDEDSRTTSQRVGFPLKIFD